MSTENLTPVLEESRADDTITARTFARVGAVGPPLFAAVVVLLTIVEWNFIHHLGWGAGLFDNSDVPWPNGLALGDYGWAHGLAFFAVVLTSVAAMLVLARQLRGESGGGISAGRRSRPGSCRSRGSSSASPASA